MELPQNSLQTFACVASEKNLSPKNGVASKFLANFCLCSIRKKSFSQKGSCLKISCKHKIFLTSVYMIFKYSKRFRFAPLFNKFQTNISRLLRSLQKVGKKSLKILCKCQMSSIRKKYIKTSKLPTKGRQKSCLKCKSQMSSIRKKIYQDF